tara:strand:+ start:5361 stop:5636 length:276 start_codon:yes stop_codon:yes gene_type:complete
MDTRPTPKPKETNAQKFYRLSESKSMADFARIVGFHAVTVRTYLLPSDRKSWKKAPISCLHDWAKSLKENGGPSIAIGLWPDGDVTFEVEQ